MRGGRWSAAAASGFSIGSSLRCTGSRLQSGQACGSCPYRRHSAMAWGGMDDSGIVASDDPAQRFAHILPRCVAHELPLGEQVLVVLSS
jgi:hypothetical protein